MNNISMYGIYDHKLFHNSFTFFDDGACLKILLSFLFIFTLSACSNSNEATPATNDQVVETMTPAGGAITWTASNQSTTADLSVPAAALSSDTDISIQSTTNIATGIIALPGTVLEFTPDGLVFNVPAELVYHYDPATLGTIPEASLKIYRISGGIVTELASTVDTNANTITAMINGFSSFQVGLDTKAPVTSASPAGGHFDSMALPDVTLTCSDLAGTGCSATYYTLDGSQPTTSSTEYTNPFTISSSSTLKYFSVDNAGNEESVNTVDFTVAQVYTIGGTVTGDTLTNWLWLDLNGVAEWSVSQPGDFVFPTVHTPGYNYTVTVKTTPPGMSCVVNNGSGILGEANVTSINVHCTNTPVASYTVGGNVSGLDGTLVLQNNGADNETLNANGSFTFNTALGDTQAYNVTVLTPPVGQTCSLSNNSGTISAANITNVAVSCSDNPIGTYTIGATVSGLNGSLVLQNNGSDDLNVNADGWHAFSALLADAATYNVTVSQHPVDQGCSVATGSGTVNGADVTDITVTCSARQWRHPASLSDNISPNGTDVEGSPEIAMDDNGNALIAWSQDDTLGPNIYLSEFRNGSWQHPETTADHLNPAKTFYSKFTAPRLAMDNNGNALVKYTRQSWAPAFFKLFLSEYRSNTWTGPADEHDYFGIFYSETGYSGSVAMNDNGNALLAGKSSYWYDSGSGSVRYSGIYTHEYHDDAWYTSTLAMHIDPDTEFSNYPEVAMDNNGNAIVVWQSNDGISNNCTQTVCDHIFMSEYRSTSWTHPADANDRISPAGLTARYPKVEMDNAGNAIVSWSQRDASTDCNGSGCLQLATREYRAGVWSDVSIISLADGLNVGTYWDIAMDDNGNAIAVWAQQDSNGENQLYMREYRNGNWSQPTLTDNFNIGLSVGSNTRPSVAMSNNGEAVIAWEENDGSFWQIFKMEYRAGTWIKPTSLTDNISPDGESAFIPKVAMDSSGNTIIGWWQDSQTDCTSNCKQVFISEYR